MVVMLLRVAANDRLTASIANVGEGANACMHTVCRVERASSALVMKQPTWCWSMAKLVKPALTASGSTSRSWTGARRGATWKCSTSCACGP